MDPKANIERQRELAEEILDRENTIASHEDGEQTWTVWGAARELAELVQALDEWRSKGGFDPYIEASDVITALYEQTYKAKMQALLGRIREACIEAGFIVDEPYDMSGDDYKWSMQVWRDQAAKDAGDTDRSIDVSVEIAESREYDGEQEYGINFGIDIVEWNGRILGGLSPFNYTEQCWVDSRDADAVSERWQIIEDADPSGVPEVINDERNKEVTR